MSHVLTRLRMGGRTPEDVSGGGGGDPPPAESIIELQMYRYDAGTAETQFSDAVGLPDGVLHPDALATSSFWRDDEEIAVNRKVVAVWPSGYVAALKLQHTRVATQHTFIDFELRVGVPPEVPEPELFDDSSRRVNSATTVETVTALGTGHPAGAFWVKDAGQRAAGNILALGHSVAEADLPARDGIASDFYAFCKQVIETTLIGAYSGAGTGLSGGAANYQPVKCLEETALTITDQAEALELHRLAHCVASRHRTGYIIPQSAGLPEDKMIHTSMLFCVIHKDDTEILEMMFENLSLYTFIPDATMDAIGARERGKYLMFAVAMLMCNQRGRYAFDVTEYGLIETRIANCFLAAFVRTGVSCVWHNYMARTNAKARDGVTIVRPWYPFQQDVDSQIASMLFDYMSDDSRYDTARDLINTGMGLIESECLLPSDADPPTMNYRYTDIEAFEGRGDGTPNGYDPTGVAGAITSGGNSVAVTGLANSKTYYAGAITVGAQSKLSEAFTTNGSGAATIMLRNGETWDSNMSAGEELHWCGSLASPVPETPTVNNDVDLLGLHVANLARTAYEVGAGATRDAYVERCWQILADLLRTPNDGHAGPFVLGGESSLKQSQELLAYSREAFDYLRRIEQEEA